MWQCNYLVLRWPDQINSGWVQGYQVQQYSNKVQQSTATIRWANVILLGLGSDVKFSISRIREQSKHANTCIERELLLK